MNFDMRYNHIDNTNFYRYKNDSDKSVANIINKSKGMNAEYSYLLVHINCSTNSDKSFSLQISPSMIEYLLNCITIEMFSLTLLERLKDEF